MERMFSGFLRIGYHREADDILLLDNEPIAEKLEELRNANVTLWYYISDKEILLTKAEESFVESLVGVLNAEYNVRYSESTGYLWTDEELQVGGHDLLSELKSFDGKYLILIVEIHELD